MEQCTAQGELRQRRAKCEVEHVKRRLEKNEAASAALLKQVRDNEREKQILLQKGAKERRQIEVDRNTMKAKVENCVAQVRISLHFILQVSILCLQRYNFTHSTAICRLHFGSDARMRNVDMSCVGYK